MEKPARQSRPRRGGPDTRFADILALVLSTILLLFVFGALIVTRG